MLPGGRWLDVVGGAVEGESLVMNENPLWRIE